MTASREESRLNFERENKRLLNVLASLGWEMVWGEERLFASTPDGRYGLTLKYARKPGTWNQARNENRIIHRIRQIQ